MPIGGNQAGELQCDCPVTVSSCARVYSKVTSWLVGWDTPGTQDVELTISGDSVTAQSQWFWGLILHFALVVKVTSLFASVNAPGEHADP